MTTDRSAQFRRMIEHLWGYGSQTKAARHFEVSDRTIRHWVAGERSIPERVMSELRTIISIAPPPGSTSEEDRDEACREAMEPALTELRDRAVASGWHPAEISAAIISFTVDEIRHHAGDAAAREILEQAAAQIVGK